MYQISDSEWEVMRVIWAQGAIGSSDIIEILSARFSWSASTVKTLLGRLVDKGLVSTQRQGRAFLYHAELSESAAQRQEMTALFSRICVTKHSGLLEELINQTPMTLSEIEGFQALLLKKKEKAVEKVACNCIPGQCACSHHEEVSHGK